MLFNAAIKLGMLLLLWMVYGPAMLRVYNVSKRFSARHPTLYSATCKPAAIARCRGWSGPF